MDNEKVRENSLKVLDVLSQCNLTFAETIEVIKVVNQALEDSLKEQARIQVGFVLKNFKD